MPSQPKLRIFAGPNGSGKTTLYNHIKSEYFSTKLFVNADQLEYTFKQVKFIDLSEFSLKVTLKNSGIKHKFIGVIKSGFIELALSIVPQCIGNFVIDKLKN